jgi:protein-S-isoprenylcysteine O-methyltransferase Ste14
MDVSGVIVTATIWAYWIGVGVMIVRVRRHTHKLSGVVPQQRLERMMWLVWLPLVAAWIALPYLALHRAQPPLGLPDFARADGVYGGLRLLAALVGVACLAATIQCWARMGKDWRMAVSVGEKQNLVTEGWFSRIRHPIYAFSMLLMICTVIVVPTWPMVVTGLVHIALMITKAHNEEQHLLASHGEGYATYLASTGRFLPRWR